MWYLVVPVFLFCVHRCGRRRVENVYINAIIRRDYHRAMCMWHTNVLENLEESNDAGLSQEVNDEVADSQAE